MRATRTSLLEGIFRLRQWTYPRHMQIVVRGDAAEGLRQCMRPPASVVAPASRKGQAQEIDARLVCKVATHAHQARIALKKAKEGVGDIAWMIESGLHHLRELNEEFEDHGFEIRDLAGRGVEGRRDFTPITQATEQSGLNRPTIIECVEPVVLFKGEMIQRARGYIARPPNTSA